MDYQNLTLFKSKNGYDEISNFKSNKYSFLFTISYTETAKIPGITIAGANTELLKYTPAADAEYIHYGKCRSINTIPATPDGKPTPAIITKTALEIGDIPITVIDSGSLIKPLLPYININSSYGKNIAIEKGVESSTVFNNYDMGKMIGKQISKNNDIIIIGESIPGGTTTALGVLCALGIDAFYKVSSSMPENPHELKNKIIEKAFYRHNLKAGDCSNNPFLAISNFGDPLMPTIAGTVKEILAGGKKVILAGGTQMCCIIAILKALNTKFNKNLCIGTTSYVMNDKNADIKGLLTQIASDIPIISIDLNLNTSHKSGLRAFSQGFVKEGAGAGGTAIAATLKNKSVTNKVFLSKIEENYENTIERIKIKTPK